MFELSGWVEYDALNQSESWTSGQSLYVTDLAADLPLNEGLSQPLTSGQELPLQDQAVKYGHPADSA